MDPVAPVAPGATSGASGAGDAQCDWPYRTFGRCQWPRRAGASPARKTWDHAMTVFVDTNILLDVLGKRLPFYDDSAAIWNLAEHRKIEAVISAVSFTNIFYIVRKLESRTT